MRLTCNLVYICGHFIKKKEILTTLTSSMTNALHPNMFQFSSVQSFNPVQLIVTLWTIAHQGSLSITNTQSLLRLISIELVMPSNHLILCHPLFLPLVFPSISVFSSELAFRIRWPKYWSLSFSMSLLDEYLGLISFRID